MSFNFSIQKKPGACENDDQEILSSTGSTATKTTSSRGLTTEKTGPFDPPVPN